MPASSYLLNVKGWQLVMQDDGNLVLYQPTPGGRVAR